MNEPNSTIGIIGLGNIGLIHAERFASLGVDVVGMDSSDDARRRFTERFDAPVFEDHDELFAAVDAVVVAVPNKYHERYAKAALEGGLDVFIEKPMANTWNSAQRIADVATTADGICVIGFHNRYRAAVERFKQLQLAGQFGDLTHVRANYVRQNGVPDHGGWFTREGVAGGGALIDIGVHAIDLALYLLGYPPIEDVVGTTRRSPDHSFDVEDASSAFIRCGDGQTISLEVAWQTNGPDDKTFSIDGSAGGARLVPGDDRLDVFDAGRRATIDVEHVNPYDQQARAFLSAVESGVHPDRNTVDEALTVQSVIERIYRSDIVGQESDSVAARTDSALAVPLPEEPYN